MKKEWAVDHRGHKIVVTHTWFFGVALYLDGERVDVDRSMLYPHRWRPTLSAVYEDPPGERHVIEVYLVVRLRVTASIFVDGKHVGGDAL